MARAALALLALAAAALPAAPRAAPPAIAAAADALAEAIGAPEEGRRIAALAVEPRAAALGGPLEAALAAALARRGWAVSPLRAAGEDPEAAARAARNEWLVRVQGGLVPGRRELALVAELVPLWPSFFLQRHPGVRPVPPRVVQARTPADAETLALGRPDRPLGAGGLALRALARVPGRVLALGIGDPGEHGAPAVVLALEREVRVLSPAGEVVAARALDLPGRAAVRDPAATVAVGELGGGRIGVAWAGAREALVLALRAGRLEVVAPLPAAPLCAAEGRARFGAFAPGRSDLLDLLSPHVDPAARPRSDATWLGVACAAPARAGGGGVALAALAPDATLHLLGDDLAPAAPPVPGVGAGFALADLDGDGEPEVVASTAEPGAPEALRVLAPRGFPALVLEAGAGALPTPGALVAGAGGDLTGDGLDDAVLAAVLDAGGAAATDLLLLTADPRYLP
jgi:hypothetical protein